MSSAKSPPAKEPATLQTTRQMLDELDALMDRMLALPVNDVDDPVPAPRDIVRTPTASATLTIMDAPAEEAPPEVEQPLLRESFPRYNTDPAASEPVGDLPIMQPPAFQPPHFEPSDYDVSHFEPSVPALAPEPDPIPEEVIPPSLATLPVPITMPEQPVIELQLPRRAFASRCLLPLLWFNQGFDKATLILGPPGRWLRGPGGRRLLGVTGLTLVVASGLWLMKDWLGWTW